MSEVPLYQKPGFCLGASHSAEKRALDSGAEGIQGHLAHNKNAHPLRTHGGL